MSNMGLRTFLLALLLSGLTQRCRAQQIAEKLPPSMKVSVDNALVEKYRERYSGRVLFVTPEAKFSTDELPEQMATQLMEAAVKQYNLNMAEQRSLQRPGLPVTATPAIVSLYCLDFEKALQEAVHSPSIKPGPLPLTRFTVSSFDVLSELGLLKIVLNGPQGLRIFRYVNTARMESCTGDYQRALEDSLFSGFAEKLPAHLTLRERRAIESRHPFIGMREELLWYALGFPEKENSYNGGRLVQQVYQHGSVMVYLKNDHVSDVQRFNF